MANYDKEFNVKNGLAVNGTVVIDSNGLISPDKIDGGVFPDQTDQSGKFLSTNGSNVLWETVDLTNVDAVTLDGHDSTYFEPANSNIQSHISDTLNPHGVTASQVGAEPANANIQTHISSTSNPHGVTAGQVGAEPANANIQTHISSTSNPHNVTASQVGAEPAITAGTTGQYWRGDKTWQTLPSPDLSAYATKESPTFTGTVTLPVTNNYATATTTNEKVGHDTMSGTSKTVTDAFITANTFVTIIPLSNPAGVLKVTSNAGNFVITSTKSETLTFKWSAIK